MEDKEMQEVYNPQSGEKIVIKKKQFWKEWRFWVWSFIALMLFFVSLSSLMTACAALNAGVGQGENSSFVQGRKGAKGTTDSGGYDKYTFQTTFEFVQDYCTTKLFELDSVNWEPTLVETLPNEPISGRFNVASYYNNIYNSIWVERKDQSKIYLIVSTGYNHFWDNVSYTRSIYVSFVASTYAQSSTPSYKTFICSNGSPNYSYPIEGTPQTGLGFTTVTANRPMLISWEKSTCFWQFEASWGTSLTFQDIASYYLEQGYSSGYDVGESDGYAEGHADGYGEGYNAGHSAGYEEGYQEATDDYNTGIAFTSYGLYANANLSLVADEVIGNFSYMYLFDYATSLGDEHNVYALFTTNSQSGAYNGYIVDRNNNPASTLSETIGSFSNQVSADVVITAEKDMYFELYTGYITSFRNRGPVDLEIFWFSGGSSGTALQNYTDGYDAGFVDGDSAGYNRGYAGGYDVGYTNGVNAAEPEALTNTLVAVFQQPFNQIYRFFNFNILGLNVLGLVCGLLSVFIVIKVIKKVI